MAILDKRGNPVKRTDRNGRIVGWGGSSILGGIPTDEYNADLRGAKGAKIADKMRRGHGQVRAVLRVLSLPVRSTKWLIEEPDGASATEKAAAQELSDNLFGGMRCSFDSVLTKGVNSAYFGFGIPEMVWAERNARIELDEVAGRNRELIERWLPDETGRIVGYVYAGSRPVGGGLTDLTGGTAKYERIGVPLAEKTLHFTYDEENESPEGIGLYRSMYPHWYFVQALQKIMGIGAERNLLGTPVGKLQESAPENARSEFLTLLSRMRAAEDAAIILEDGQSLDNFGSESAFVDGLPLVHYHNNQIALVALAQFINLGLESVGTQALGQTHAQLFMDAEEALARWIEETINSQLIKVWMLYNYGEGLNPPLLRHRRIAANSLESIAKALQMLVAGKLITPGADDEEYLRDVAELPAVPKDQLEANREKAASQPAPQPPPNDNPNPNPNAGG